jgi:hypothetical protein
MEMRHYEVMLVLLTEAHIPNSESIQTLHSAIFQIFIILRNYKLNRDSY